MRLSITEAATVSPDAENEKRRGENKHETVSPQRQSNKGHEDDEQGRVCLRVENINIIKARTGLKGY